MNLIGWSAVYSRTVYNSCFVGGGSSFMFFLLSDAFSLLFRFPRSFPVSPFSYRQESFCPFNARSEHKYLGKRKSESRMVRRRSRREERHKIRIIPNQGDLPLMVVVPILDVCLVILQQILALHLQRSYFHGGFVPQFIGNPQVHFDPLIPARTHLRFSLRYVWTQDED